jgi:hypothetical protein
MGHSVNRQVFKSVLVLDAEIINLLEAADTLSTAKNNNFGDEVRGQAFALLQVVTRLRAVLAEHSV